jgi:hypothetical protein
MQIAFSEEHLENDSAQIHVSCNGDSKEALLGQTELINKRPECQSALDAIWVSVTSGRK